MAYLETDGKFGEETSDGKNAIEKMQTPRPEKSSCYLVAPRFYASPDPGYRLRSKLQHAGGRLHDYSSQTRGKSLGKQQATHSAESHSDAGPAQHEASKPYLEETPHTRRLRTAQRISDNAGDALIETDSKVLGTLADTLLDRHWSSLESLQVVAVHGKNG